MGAGQYRASNNVNRQRKESVEAVREQFDECIPQPR